MCNPDPGASLPKTKAQIKREYQRGEIGLSDAVASLMLDHGLEHLQALKYLGL